MPIVLRSAQQQKGFTLTETMVGITVGLLMMAGIITLIIGVGQGNRQVEDASRLMQNGSYASDYLREQFRHAGFHGELYPPGTALWPLLPNAQPDPCAAVTQASLRAGLPLHLQGEDSSEGDPVTTCLTDADHVDGTDIFFIRRGDVLTSDLAALSVNADEAGNFFMQTASTEFALGVAGNLNEETGFGVRTRDAAGNLIPASLRRLHVDGFYLSPRNRPVDAPACDGEDELEGQTVPTLMQLRLRGNSLCAEPIATGIENLQIEYGIDNDEDGAPDEYVENPASVSAWSNVVTVRMFLLARGESTDNPVPALQFQLGDEEADLVKVADDKRSRHVFTSTVRLRNISGRREAP